MGQFEVYADQRRNTLNVDYPSEGWYVDNTQCAADVTIQDVRGIGFTIKAGNLYALNFTPATTMFAFSTSTVVNGGTCRITSSESALNTDSNNPQALVATVNNPTIVPNPLPVSGNVGFVPGSTIGLTPGNTVGLIPGTGITVNNDVTDPVARSYLAALQGLLPQSIHTFVFNGNVGAGPNAEQTFTLINATTQLSVAVIMPVLNGLGYDGILWIWYELAGTRVYVVNKTYWNTLAAGYQSQLIAPWETYSEYIPAGAKIGVGLEAQGTVLVRF
jgi:hypothetical protein